MIDPRNDPRKPARRTLEEVRNHPLFAFERVDSHPCRWAVTRRSDGKRAATIWSRPYSTDRDGIYWPFEMGGKRYRSIGAALDALGRRAAK